MRRSSADIGTRVAPKHSTKEGYDNGTIQGFENGLAVVYWDKANETYNEDLADLVELRA